MQDYPTHSRCFDQQLKKQKDCRFSDRGVTRAIVLIVGLRPTLSEAAYFTKLSVCADLSPPDSLYFNVPEVTFWL